MSATTPAADGAMTRRVGDEFAVDGPRFPGVWTITKVNPTTYRGEQNGRFLKAHKHLTRNVTAADRAATPAPVRLTQVPAPSPVPFGGITPDGNPPIGQPYKDVMIFDIGALVTLNNPKYPGLYVVIADKVHTTGRVNVAKLGGDSGRYVRANPAGLTIVKPADFLK